MSVTIGEVQVDAPEHDSPEPRAHAGATPGGGRSPRPDPEDLRVLLRREEDRALRLWVD